MKTKFEADVIQVSDFKQKYLDFCEENRLNPINVTRSLMASYGVETEKLELSYVCRKPLAVLKKEADGKASPSKAKESKRYIAQQESK